MKPGTPKATGSRWISSAQTVTTPGGESFKFEIDPFAKHCLLNGLDEIGLTLQHADQIKAFEAKHRERQPWLFG